MRGMRRIYFDYAATTPVHREVVRAMLPYFSDFFGNPGSIHKIGQTASGAVFKARQTIAKSIGADYREIIFTGSATEANNLVLRGVIGSITNNLKFKKYHPRIIVSSIEHESILETAKDLENEGVEVIYLPVSRNGLVDLDKLKASLNEQTVLVSIMYANNEIGTVQSISEIAKIVSDFRKQIANRKEQSVDATQFAFSAPLLHTDAAQAFQYLDCDVMELGVDFMTLSAHKIYGPKGIGALYIRNSKQETRNTKQILNLKSQISNLPLVLPMVTGGGQENGLRSGTENTPSIVGFAKAVELIEKNRNKESVRINKLRKYFWSGLKKAYPKAEINGLEANEFKNRLPNNLNIYFPGVLAQDFLIRLDLTGISASAGSACSSRASKPSYVLKELGFSPERAGQSIRFTLGRQNKKQEIDKALKVIRILLNNGKLK